MSLFNSGRPGLRVTQFRLHTTGTYNQQFRRPYQTTMDGSTADIFNERLHNQNNITAEALSGIASSFIKPMATPEVGLQIENGWDQPRMRFYMEVETVYPGMATKITEIILGWSNYDGVTLQGSIDPNIVFTINSVVTTRTLVERTPLGNQTNIAVADNSHLLVEDNWNGIYSADKTFRMRPEDVYSMMTVNQMPNMGTLLDQRTLNTNMAVKSSRLNSVASNYMAGILNNWKSAEAQDQINSTQMETIERARSYSAEQSAARDPFISAIAAIRQQPAGKQFTYAELMKLDPNVDNIATIMFLGPTDRVHQIGESCPWSGSDIYTQVATILSQAVPGLMMKQGMTFVTLKSTNQDFSGQVTTVVYNTETFASGTTREIAVKNFIQDFNFQVAQEISFQNGIPYELEMQADLIGETVIRLRLDGREMVEFVTPSFCDSIMVPVVTSNNQLATTLASDFDSLLNQVISSSNFAQPQALVNNFGSGFGTL